VNPAINNLTAGVLNFSDDEIVLNLFI